VGIGVGLVLLLVLVVAAARHLPAWAGGILLGLAGGIALLVPVEIEYVILGLIVGALVALAVYGQRTREFGWQYLAIPAGAVVVVMAMMSGGMARKEAVPAPTIATSEMSRSAREQTGWGSAGCSPSDARPSSPGRWPRGGGACPRTRGRRGGVRAPQVRGQGEAGEARPSRRPDRRRDGQRRRWRRGR